MSSYGIYLKNSAGDYQRGDRPQEGWVTEHGLLFDQLAVSKDPSSARRFDSEEKAEDFLLELEQRFGLDREEAAVEEFVAADRTFAMRLGGPDDDDGISVVEEGGSRWITVRNFGAEASEQIPDEVADLLVCVLWKVSERLKKSAAARGDGRTEQ